MIEASSAQHQITRTQTFYDRWSQAFIDDYSTSFQAGFLNLPESGEDPVLSAVHLARRAGITAGARVLDAGCGVGGPAIAIAGHIDVEIVGVTVSHRQVEIARGLVHDAELSDRVTVMFADYESLPFAPASFDHVVFFESTGYSLDKGRLMAEAFRVLRPGGQVYVKDVVVKDQELTQAERDDQATFDEMWAMHATPTLADLTAAMHTSGFVAVGSGQLDNVTNYRFLGSQVRLDPQKGLVPTELSKAFKAAPVPNLPTVFGEAFGTKPE